MATLTANLQKLATVGIFTDIEASVHSYPDHLHQTAAAISRRDALHSENCPRAETYNPSTFTLAELAERQLHNSFKGLCSYCQSTITYQGPPLIAGFNKVVDDLLPAISNMPDVAQRKLLEKAANPDITFEEMLDLYGQSVAWRDLFTPLVASVFPGGFSQVVTVRNGDVEEFDNFHTKWRDWLLVMSVCEKYRLFPYQAKITGHHYAQCPHCADIYNVIADEPIDLEECSVRAEALRVLLESKSSVWLPSSIIEGSRGLVAPTSTFSHQTWMTAEIISLLSPPPVIVPALNSAMLKLLKPFGFVEHTALWKVPNCWIQPAAPMLTPFPTHVSGDAIVAALSHCTQDDIFALQDMSIILDV